MAARTRRSSPCRHKLTKMYDGINDITDMQQIQLERVKHFFTHYKDLEPGKWAKI